MAMSPMVKVGGDKALNWFTYLFGLVVSLISMFVLTLVVLGARWSMGFSDVNVAERAIYLAIVGSVSWYMLVRFWPFDRRATPTLNPAIEVGRLVAGDNLGVLPAAANIGVQLGGAAIGGIVVQQLGWTQFGATCLPVAVGTAAGCTALNEALPQASSTLLYAFDFFLTTLVVFAYVVPKKMFLYKQDTEERWSATTASSAIMLFIATMTGVPLGFIWFNPAIYFGSYVATGMVDVKTNDGVLDSIIFILTRMLASGILAGILYYVLRGIVWLSERYNNRVIRATWRKVRGQGDGAEAHESLQNQGAAVSGLRSRTTSSRTPLNVDF